MKTNLVIALLFLGLKVQAQQKFSQCSAAFVNNTMLATSYTKNAKAKVNINAKGFLTVCTSNISSTITKPVAPIPFMIARKDKNTGTLSLYSNKIYTKQSVEAVLKTCRKGDKIVLITTSDEYALPHNEILVE
jgi:hypothetical protein